MMITAWIGSIMLLGIAILYVFLAMGMPFGEFAMGGKNRIMPKSIRIACLVSVPIQIIGIMDLLQTGNVISTGFPHGIEKDVCYFFAAYLLLNTIMNFLSKSKKERAIMTPLSLITAICFGLAAISR